VADHSPNAVAFSNAAATTGIPGSATPAHPSDGIPLPRHGFSILDGPDGPARPLVPVAADEVINAAAVALINAAAEKLGLTAGAEPDLDLPAARRLINALAGLLAAAQHGQDDQDDQDAIGDTAESLRQGLRTVQQAFREAAAHPDPPGMGPGEAFLS
jgi:hypothetical protein